MSKLEDGQMKTEIVHGDLVEYTEKIVERFQPTAIKKDLKLGFKASEKNWKTNFDKNKWNKIVYNLLSNAMKFTPDGGSIKLNLAKEQNKGNEFLQFEISDTGVGIASEHLPQIFDRFYQADNSPTRAQGGTGIGLSLVKELIELQGGEITVESALGKGTKFKILLPVLRSEKMANSIIELQEKDLLRLPEVKKNHGDISESIVGQSIKNIERTKDKLDLLLIEDNNEMREYIRSCIDESKYNISEASDGAEGLQKILTEVPDLIISDVMMPKKTGFEVVKAIRNNMTTSHIPVILLTAKASLESRLEGVRGGADVYLTKPFNARELVLRIKKLIEIRQSLQKRYSGQQPISQNGTPTLEDEFIANLRGYVLKNIDVVQINGDVVGRHLGMSRGHLYRKLKALSGMSISEYVKAIRLEKAKELLKEKRWTISEITHKTGFSSISHFSRSFKAAYGKSPTGF